MIGRALVQLPKSIRDRFFRFVVTSSGLRHPRTGTRASANKKELGMLRSITTLMSVCLGLVLLAGCQSTGMKSDTMSADSGVVSTSNQGTVVFLAGHGGDA